MCDSFIFLLIMCDGQTVDAKTLKPWGLSPDNWSNRGQIRRAQCPPGTGSGKADLGCPIQGSGQVIVVPWQCENLQLYRQKFASECSQPHQKVSSPSDFPHVLAGGWCSSRSYPWGWVTLTWGGCLCSWAFLHLRAPACVGFGTCRAFPSVLLEEWGLSLWLARRDTSCISMGRCPHGPHEILMKPQHHQQPRSMPLPTLVLSFFSSLSLRSVCSVLGSICTSPSQNVVAEGWKREDMNKYGREKNGFLFWDGTNCLKEKGFLTDAQRTNVIS